MTTCAQSLASVNRKMCYDQILEVFRESDIPLKARDVMLELLRRKDIPEPDMNFVRPRLTELVEEGLLIRAGTAWDSVTRRNVTTYTLTPAEGNGQLRLF